MTGPVTKKSDLGVRTLSALVMITVSGGALWLGGWAWTIFVAVVAMALLWEWRGLVRGFAPGVLSRTVWNAGGFVYIAVAAGVLLVLRHEVEGAKSVLLVVGAVIGTDIGAYALGRAIGGPKIAPRISPSKTWAGLVGGMIGAALALAVISWVWTAGLCEAFYPGTPLLNGRFQFDGPCSFGSPPLSYLLASVALFGPLVAILAQAGDFFESWMKRRAGVKDSSSLIPGHGGVLDRLDGLLTVLVVVGAITLLDAIRPGLG